MAALNVAGMMEAANTRADNFATYVKDQTKIFENQVSNYVNEHAKILNMSTDTTAGLSDQQTALSRLHDEMQAYADKVASATQLVNGNLTSIKTELQTTNDLLTNLEKKDYASLNATTKQLLQDSSTNYKQTFIAVCVKAGVCLILLYFVWEHWFDALVIFGGIIIVWVMITAIIFVWGKTFKNESVASAGNPVQGTVDTCKNDNYMRLASVCRDGTPNTGNCATVNLCWDTEFGCCMDNQTPMKTADDTCALTPCESTMFGCCPNGVPKLDQLGSNCTDNALCGSSPWGCNFDGTFITARLASEMAKETALPKLDAEQEKEKEKEKCKEVLGVNETEKSA